MDPAATKKAQLAKLNEEMEGIHSLNSLYWAQGEAVTLKARAAYERRKERLEEIRSKLTQLQSS